MKFDYDIAIVGCGAVGSAALYHASKLGVKVIAFDLFNPPHIYGSSHGETRIVRRAIGENSSYSLLSSRSYKIWEEIERQTNQTLLNKNGCLVLASDDAPSRFFENTLSAAQKYGIDNKVLDTDEIHKKFPEFSNLKNIRGYLETEGGFINPELTIKAQIDLAKQNGAICKNVKIISLYEKNGGIYIHGENGYKVTASKVLLSTGPWIKDLLPPELRKLFKTCRQVLYWFDFKNAEHFDAKKFPVFTCHLSNDQNGVYGFPAINGKKYGVKLATHNVLIETDQKSINRSVHQDEICSFYDTYIKDSFYNVVTPNCLKSAVCSYTITPDNNFIVDFIPDNPRALFVSACSGHGFKHSTAIGELSISMLLGLSMYLDHKVFSYSRYFADL